MPQGECRDRACTGMADACMDITEPKSWGFSPIQLFLERKMPTLGEPAFLLSEELVQKLI